MNPIEIIKWNFDYLFNLAGLDSAAFSWLWGFVFAVAAVLFGVWLIRRLAVLFRRQPPPPAGASLDQMIAWKREVLRRRGFAEIFPPWQLIGWTSVFFVMWMLHGSMAGVFMVIIVLIIVFALI